MEYFSTIASNLHCEVEANTDNFATTTAKSRLWKGLASDHFSDMSKKYNQGGFKGKKISPKAVAQYTNQENLQRCPVLLFKNKIFAVASDLKGVFYLQSLLMPNHLAGFLSSH